MDGRPGGLNSGVKFGLGIGRADEFVQEDRCHSPGVFAGQGFQFYIPGLLILYCEQVCHHISLAQSSSFLFSSLGG